MPEINHARTNVLGTLEQGWLYVFWGSNLKDSCSFGVSVAFRQQITSKFWIPFKIFVVLESRNGLTNTCRRLQANIQHWCYVTMWYIQMSKLACHSIRMTCRWFHLGLKNYQNKFDIDYNQTSKKNNWHRNDEHTIKWIMHFINPKCIWLMGCFQIPTSLLTSVVNCFT